MANSLFNFLKKNNAEQSLKYPAWASYEPALIPPPELMGKEGINVLEEWFRWAEEWSLLLRLYGKITMYSEILEIGCGLGRIAFPLRYILRSEGSYHGFEISAEKVEFLQDNFNKTHPNFNFTWANVHNTYYNPEGDVKANEYCFPYMDNSFDVVFAASVFTHMLPDAATNYFKQAARVLRPGGKAVFSFFILDNYVPKKTRPKGFDRPGFNFDFSYESYGEKFAISNPENAEEMTAFKLNFIQELAAATGLKLSHEPVHGYWSGKYENWVSTQDLIVMEKI